MNRRWMSRKYIPLVRLLERADFVSKPVFECNVCNRPIRHPFDSPAHKSDVFEKMRVVGGGFRKKEQCPFCLSNDRLRFTIEVLSRYTDILSRPCKVLEFAPIQGLEMYLKARGNCEYISGDIVSGRAMRVLDITNIDFPDATFDYVICNHVLEHIDNEEKAVREMMRVTKPGGCLLISMPVALSLEQTLESEYIDTPEKRLLLYGQGDHVRLYGRDVKKRLEQYGLDVTEIIAKDDTPDAVERYGLIPEDRNYLCRYNKA